MAMRDYLKDNDNYKPHISETLKKKEKELLELLKQMEDSYSENSSGKPEFPSLDLDKIDHVFKSDADIEKEVSDKMAEKSKSDYEKILQELQNKNDALEKEKESLQGAKTQAEKSLDESYNHLEEKTNNNLLKRGIARSSIAALSEGQINEKRQDAKQSLTKQYMDETKALDNKINALEGEKITALKNNDLKYSELIDSEIARLKKEQTDILKYNNSVTEKEAKYQRELEKLMYDYAQKNSQKLKDEQAYEKENGYTGAKKKEYENRLNAAVEFYSQVDPRVVPSLLKNNVQLKSYLGNYYNTLVGMFSR